MTTILSSTLSLEQTYTLRQNYLKHIAYQSHFESINKNTDFDLIGKYIDNALSDTTSLHLPLDIHYLHKQLDSIVYLSNLSYYYIKNSGKTHLKLLPQTSRLIKLWEFLQQKQVSFYNDLHYFIEKLTQENKDAENLILAEINYLRMTAIAQPSKLAKLAAKLIKKIDLNEMKAQSEQSALELDNLLQQAKRRYSEKENITNSKELIMPELKDDSLEEEKKEIDNDTDSEYEFFDAEDSESQQVSATPEQKQEKNIMPDNLEPQPTLPIPAEPQENNVVNINIENKIAEPLITQPISSFPEQNQDKNPSNRKNLFVRIWNVIKEIWQNIKNSFKNSKKNHKSDNTPPSQPSAEPPIITSSFKHIADIKESPAVKTPTYTAKSQASTTAHAQQHPSENVIAGYIKR